MGRVVAFLGRLANDNPGIRYGVGVDQSSAVMLDLDGTASVDGIAAYFLTALANPPGQLKPLQYLNVAVYRLPKGDQTKANFDFNTWKGTGGHDYTVSAQDGTLTSTGNSKSNY